MGFFVFRNEGFGSIPLSLLHCCSDSSYGRVRFPPCIVWARSSKLLRALIGEPPAPHGGGGQRGMKEPPARRARAPPGADTAQEVGRSAHPRPPGGQPHRPTERLEVLRVPFRPASSFARLSPFQDLSAASSLRRAPPHRSFLSSSSERKSPEQEGEPARRAEGDAFLTGAIPLRPKFSSSSVKQYMVSPPPSRAITLTVRS
jgi:hypothetical protein